VGAPPVEGGGEGGAFSFLSQEVEGAAGDGALTKGIKRNQSML